MPFYWSLSDMPELKNLPRAERKKVLKDVMKGDRKYLALLAMIVPMVAIYFIGVWLDLKGGTWQSWATIFVAVFVGSLTMQQVWIRMYRSDIRDYVAKMSKSREAEGG
jgi:hypothetical protein